MPARKRLRPIMNVLYVFDFVFMGFLWSNWNQVTLVSGYDLQFTSDMGRRARTITPKPVVRAAPALVRNARERSLGVRGAKLFDLLP